MCKLHNKFYNENIDAKVQNISDIALANRADEIANNPMYDEVRRKDCGGQTASRQCEWTPMSHPHDISVGLTLGL